MDLRDFWQRFQSGIDVAVGGDAADKLLGVRDGFVRYFQHALSRPDLDKPLSVAVVPQPHGEARDALPLSDLEILELARSRAADLEDRLGGQYAFCVGSESGLLTVEAGSDTRWLVRTWTVIRGLGDETWGSSGSIQLPQSLVRGLDEAELPFAIPGRRRRGGMVGSLTGGAASRRQATAEATFHALATMLYGVLESRRPPH